MSRHRALILLVLSLGGCSRPSSEPLTGIKPSAATASVSAPEILDGWSLVTSRQGDFTVLFPGTPKIEVGETPRPCGPVPLYSYLLERPNGAVYGVLVSDIAQAVSASRALTLPDELGRAAVKKFGGIVQSSRSFQVGGVAGHELGIEIPSQPGLMLLRTLIVQERYYQLIATPGPTRSPRDQEDVTRFLDSFRFTPEASPAPDLLAARHGFTTRLIPSSYEPDGPCPEPPRGVLDLVHYPSAVGKLAALITPDPKDGKRHPAMLWAHGGFGGIGDFLWKPAPRGNDQSARAFREAGIVLMIPSWRGENDNPGRFELFYGEVEDLLAARDYLASLPYVDPERIYLGGHSSGGTMTLLAAASTDRFRAAFSFGGAPDLARIVSDGKGYGNTPFNCSSREEGRLRSAIYFTRGIKRPTFYLEGEKSSYPDEAREMKRRADEAGAPFEVAIVKGGSHFDILDPMTRLIARKILDDTGPSSSIQLTEREVEAAYAARRR